MENAVSDEGQVTSKSGSPSTSLADDPILTDAGFYWREGDGVRILVCEPLERAGFVNGFSTRLGGVSAFPENDLNLAGYDEDSAENIEENRRRFLRLFDSDFRLATVWQIHSDRIKLIAGEDAIEMSDEKFDALVSELEGILLGVKTADCVPVLIGDRRTRAFAAVHAGWRGTAQSIVVKTVEKMRQTFATGPSDLVCAIGPAATSRSYEIGQEVIDTFRSNFDDGDKYLSATSDGHALIDLHSANRDQLVASGVSPKAIYTAPFCTMERTDLFFSYRVEKKLYGKTGRLMSVIGTGKSTEDAVAS